MICVADALLSHRSAVVHVRVSVNWNGHRPCCTCVAIDTRGDGSHRSTALTLLALYAGNCSHEIVAELGTLASVGASVSCLSARPLETESK